MRRTRSGVGAARHENVYMEPALVKRSGRPRIDNANDIARPRVLEMRGVLAL